MKRKIEVPLIAQILIPAMLIVLLGISPTFREATNDLEAARRALAVQSVLVAAENIRQAAEILPRRADLWEIAGIYALQGGDARAAVTYFQKATEAGHLYAAGYTSLGTAAYQAGDLVSAGQAWETALALGDDPLQVHDNLLQLHLQQGDYPEALVHLQSLAQLQPGDAQIHFQLGLLLTATSPESAPAHLILAADLDPSVRAASQTILRNLNTARLAEEPAYNYLAAGRALAALDEWELAGEAFRQAIQIRPGYAEAWAFLGEALQRIKTTENAGFSELQKGYVLNPDSLVVNLFFALYWQRQDRFDLALTFLYAAADLEEENPVIQAEIGNTLIQLGNLSGAMHHYQRAAELAPKDPAYWRLLAAFTTRTGVLVREIGLPAAREAVLINPDDPASLVQIAQVFLLLNDPLSAQRFLLRALQADPNYAPAHLNLGLSYLFEGDRVRASQQLGLAGTLAEPESFTADQVRRLLDNYFP